MRVICTLLLYTSLSLAAPTSNLRISAYSGPVSTPLESATASAASPSSTVSLLPEPNRQPTCDSPLYCPGPILQAIQLAGLYEDSKTFVDKPASKPTEEIVAAFANLTNNRSPTAQDLVEFVDENFLGEGLELEVTQIDDYVDAPAFLANVTDEVVQAFSQIVHSYWTGLARQSASNYSCEACESSFIRLNHSFVVPGGRFRENYYWDSFWILEGLLKSELYTLARNTILNFCDLIEYTGGFIPNGARIYYLNRSQPPLFIQMISLYVDSTGDTSILSQALSAAEKEMQWWKDNRFQPVTIAKGRTVSLARYDVDSSAPRPESYREDYYTAFGEPDEASPGFDNATIDNLFANLASGAESGLDYSSARWAKEPLVDPNDIIPSLRTLNTNQIVPVDLNSILYNDYRLLGLLYRRNGSTYSEAKSQSWADQAATLRQNVIDTFWDEDRTFFYDFNSTSGSKHYVWSPASYYALWSYIWPDSLLSSQTRTQEFFSSLSYLVSNYNGSSVVASLLTTGQQWDAPSAWPCHSYIAVQALENLPLNLTSEPFQAFSTSNLQYTASIAQQTNVNKTDLPQQNVLGSDQNITSVSSFAELGNVGNITASGSWRDGLVTALINRYVTSAYCSWYATGGSIPSRNLVPQASEQELNVTDSVGNTGNMYEKFNLLAVDAAGSGGEYEVQTGFGWTNGVLLWSAANYGNRIVRPSCPSILLEGEEAATSSRLRARNIAHLASKKVKRQ